MSFCMIDNNQIVMSNDISPHQLRAARALIGWTRDDLSAKARTTSRTIARIEDGDSDRPHAATIEAIRAALEKAGVEFIPENGGGAGVRLRKPSGTGRKFS
jgi:transcriptional regulator with XRE-family HTH domain